MIKVFEGRATNFNGSWSIGSQHLSPYLFRYLGIDWYTLGDECQGIPVQRSKQKIRVTVEVLEDEEIDSDSPEPGSRFFVSTKSGSSGGLWEWARNLFGSHKPSDPSGSDCSHPIPIRCECPNPKYCANAYPTHTGKYGWYNPPLCRRK